MKNQIFFVIILINFSEATIFSKAKEILGTKTNEEEKKLVKSDDNFFMTVYASSSDYANNFTNYFRKPLNLIGEYEIACSEVIFSNTMEIELGEVEIEFLEASPRYSAKNKIKGYLGNPLINIIENINKALLKTTIEFEYKRRLRLRKKYKVEETEHIFNLGGVTLLLPLSDNDIYNSVVNEDIRLISPKLELNDKFVFYRHTKNYKITLHGNINNFFNYTTDNSTHSFNTKTNRLPDFNTIIYLQIY
jgi:hypothetical protein